MNVLAARMKRDYPQNYPPNGGLTISVVPLINQVVGDVRLALYVLLGAVGLVLLIACGNVANLLLSRGAVRQKEMAIRAAVGASRERIVRQLLTEAVLLAALGGLLGLALAIGAVKGLSRFGPANIPRLGEIGIDGRVLAFTFAIALVTGVVFGLVPALRASRLDLNDVLREGGRGGVGTSAFGLGHQQLRKLLIAAEIALSLVLLIGAGLLVRSYQRITSANPGFDPTNVLSFRLALPGFKYKTPEAVIALLQAARGSSRGAARRAARRVELSAAAQLSGVRLGADHGRWLRAQGGGRGSHHREQRLREPGLLPGNGDSAAQGPVLRRP